MAIEAYEKALIQLKEINKQSLSVEIQLKLANLCRLIKKIDTAFGYYKMVLAKHPNNLVALWNISGLYFEQKMFIPAKNCLEKMTAHQPKFSKAKLMLAKVYYQIGEYQKSINEIKKYFEVNEDVSLTTGNEASLLLADNYIALKRFSDAITVLKSQLTDNNISGNVLLKIVICLIKDNKSEKAIELTDDHLIRIPVQERCGILYAIGQAYKDIGEIYKALSVWKTAFNINQKYMDLNDIFLHYRLLIDNTWLENYYTTNDSSFEKYSRKKLNILMEENLIEKQKTFWVFKSDNIC
jgi:tetratricopeptide (TPR) repeat protein